jgi:hypothetical protein
MLRKIAVSLCVMMILWLGIPHVAAQSPTIAINDSVVRHALVIGNASYRESPLKNPASDAADVAQSLRSIGFKVEVRRNLDLNAMRLAVSQFAESLPENSAAIFYYAGHGVQHDGRNYLLPVDSIGKIQNPDDLERFAVNLSDVVDDVSRTKASINIFILDACRDSPFARIPAIRPGLARSVAQLRSADTGRNPDTPRTTEGILIAYSTSPSAVALDGTGRNSPYTKHLKDHLRAPGATIEDILKLTRASVTKETKGQQTPWYESSISGNFIPAGSDRISFEDLLKSFLPSAANSGANMISWDMAAGPFSAIRWKHAGLTSPKERERIFDINVNEWTGFARTGETIITLNGKPTHTVLEKTRKPVPWRIDMMGSLGGATAIRMSNDFSSQDFAGFGKQKYLQELPACRSGIASSGSTVYSVGMAGRQPAWLAESWSCGSGGCSFDYELFFSETDKTNYKCR